MVSQNKKQSNWSGDFARLIKEILHDQLQAACEIDLVSKKSFFFSHPLKLAEGNKSAPFAAL